MASNNVKLPILQAIANCIKHIYLKCKCNCLCGCGDKNIPESPKPQIIIQSSSIPTETSHLNYRKFNST